MKEELTAREVVELLEKTCLEMESAQEELQELDGRAGDGDLGVTVKLGFSAVRENLPRLVTSDSDIGSILTQSGSTFNRAAASTFGTLMATAFMRAGRAAKGRDRINLGDWAEMIRAATDGVMERGKAAPGECTMLDALVPAREAIEKCAAEGCSLDEALARAAQAAESGARATAEMVAKHGRAGWLGQRSLGVPDAGASAIAIMLRAVARHWCDPEPA